MSRPALALIATLIALVASGCGAREQATEPVALKPVPFTVMLDYLPNANHAGIYAAEARGEFTRAGLAVRLLTPPSPAAPLKQLEDGGADLAISQQPELMLARDRGANVLAIGALVNRPLAALVAASSSRIKRVQDLAGKTVGTAGLAYQDVYLDAITERPQVPNVNRKNVGFNLTSAVASNKVDATLGSYWNISGIELERRGKRPTVLRVDELGVPAYDELIFAVKRETLSGEQSSRIRRFIQAVARGTRAVADDPAVGADALLRAEPSLDRATVTAQIKATLPAFLPRKPKQPYGYLDVGAWDRYRSWLLDRGALRKPKNTSDSATTEFLPGQGLADPRRP